jgi:hypothetical protein
MLATTAGSTCAVQMLDVAFSRRMCCSRVCNASRYAGAPCASMLTPTSRPGIERLNSSLVARKAACGPPLPIGMPKRWVLPTTMSAPISPGGVSKTSASRSAATIARPPFACTASMTGFRSRTTPLTPGYCSNTANASACTAASAGPMSTVTPIGAARVRTTSSVCGSTSSATKSVVDLLLPTRIARVIASAAAVASSSIDEPAMAMPVSSHTMVWKLTSASIRPCEISAWYGV